MFKDVGAGGEVAAWGEVERISVSIYVYIHILMLYACVCTYAYVDHIAGR